jgi:hypothetical protein
MEKHASSVMKINVWPPRITWCAFHGWFLMEEADYGIVKHT